MDDAVLEEKVGVGSGSQQEGHQLDHVRRAMGSH